MEVSLWRRAGEIVVEALELEGVERQGYIKEATAGDPALREEVVEYLASHDQVGSSFLQEPLFHIQPNQPTAGIIGRRFGPYALEKLLGHGGMGTVYLAKRVDGAFNREVAIKLVGLAMDRQEVVRSLERERQILAGLEHPNIAGLLDAGTTEEGWPYFVMEYIAGEPINDYCRRRRLTIDQRLDLIHKICSAVQYAHQNLVIHRDLKPGNILVDDQGQPHLLDFGIAKILRPGPQPTVTARGHRPMTLEYASPEQLLYRPITVASDVYSLGLVFWELLTGRQAVRLEGLSPKDIERVICEQELPPPSVSVLGSLGSREETLAAEFREKDLKKLAQRLHGDLDNIASMALRKEPERRFASVERFAEDLRRNRTGLPVLASKDTFPYRASKFLRRNGVAVATAAFIVCLMLASIVSLLRQRAEITEQRDAAQRLSDEVALERDSAEEVTNFLLRLFQGADPKEGKRYAMTAREMLDEGSGKVAALDVKPLVKANLMIAIGNSYLGMGLYAKAAELYEQALELRRSVLGDDHLEVGELLHQIAATHEKRGLYERADELFGQALVIFERELGPEDITVAFCVDYRAAVYLAQERYEEAEANFLRAKSIKEKVNGREHRTYAGALNNLAALYRTMGRYGESEAMQRESVEVVARVLGREHPDSTLVENNLATILRLQGRYAEAEPLAERSLEVRIREYGPDHPRVVGALSDLAALYDLQGRDQEAEDLYLQSLEISIRTLREDHPYVATSRSGLAKLYLKQRRYTDAAESFEQALGIRTRNLGPNHSKVAEILQGQGDLHREQEQDAQAEDLYRQALEIQRDRLGEEHPSTQATLEAYGSLLQMTDHGPEVEAPVATNRE